MEGVPRLHVLLAALALSGARPEATAFETCTNPKGGVIPLDYAGCVGFTGKCFPWMNAACNRAFACECKEDECIMHQQCVPRGGCPTVTGGTCVVAGCDAWRNATCDEAAARCLCGAGTCPVNGECRPPGTCAKDTGGTCGVLGCKAWRNAECSVRWAPGLTEKAKCMCAESACPLNGECVPEGGCPRFAGGSCGWFGIFGGCSAGRCDRGFCVCPEGQCFVYGECVPATEASIRLSRDWAAAQESSSAWDPPAPAALALGALFAAASACGAALRRVCRRAPSSPPLDYEHLEG